MDPKVSEFTALQRELRHSELNRKSYADESYQLLRKQQATISKLRTEAEELRSELCYESRQSTQTPAEVAQAARQQEEIEKLENQVAIEKQRLREIDHELAAVQKSTVQRRKAMGGVNAARESQMMINKQIKILENRLDQALVKFNQALAKNKSLREEIDDLRRERLVFDNIYKKLEKELHEKKKQMANLIELSNLAYEQRDNFQMEIAAIEQANRKEQDEFEAQMLELNRLLEHELQMPASPKAHTIHIKQDQHGNAYSMDLIDTSSGHTNNQQLDFMFPQPQETTTQKSPTSPKHKSSSSAHKERQELQQGEERVQNFEKAFERVRTATGISSIDELVRIFIKNEEQNFSLFNYVNEQTNEIEKLDEQVQQLREEEAKYAHESGEDVNQHKLILIDLEAKIQHRAEHAEKLQTKCDDYQQLIDRLKQVIASTYARCCSDAKASSTIMSSPKFGSTSPTTNSSSGGTTTTASGVSEANFLQYLAIIEEQCNTIIKQYCQVKAKQAASRATMLETSSNDGLRNGGLGTSKPTPSVLGTGPTTPMGQELIHVNPPKLEDYSSEDEDDDDETRPLSRTELKAKTLNRMYRRVNRDQGGNTQKQSGPSSNTVGSSNSNSRTAKK